MKCVYKSKKKAPSMSFTMLNKVKLPLCFLVTFLSIVKLNWSQLNHDDFFDICIFRQAKINFIPVVLCIFNEFKMRNNNIFFLPFSFSQTRSLFLPLAPPDFCQRCQYTPHPPSSRCQGPDRAPAQANRNTHSKSHSVPLRKRDPSSDLSGK